MNVSLIIFPTYIRWALWYSAEPNSFVVDAETVKDSHSTLLSSHSTTSILYRSPLLYNLYRNTKHLYDTSKDKRPISRGTVGTTVTRIAGTVTKTNHTLHKNNTPLEEVGREEAVKEAEEDDDDDDNDDADDNDGDDDDGDDDDGDDDDGDEAQVEDSSAHTVSYLYMRRLIDILDGLTRDRILDPLLVEKRSNKKKKKEREEENKERRDGQTGSTSLLPYPCQVKVDRERGGAFNISLHINIDPVLGITLTRLASLILEMEPLAPHVWSELHHYLAYYGAYWSHVVDPSLSHTSATSTNTLPSVDALG